MWWSVLLAGASGALAAVVASVIVRDSKKNWITYSVVFVIAFVILSSVSRSYILPEIRIWEARGQASRFIEENRIFSLLVSRHPELREQLTNLMVELTRKGATKEQAFDAGIVWGRKLLGPYFEQYIPRASDEALISFVSLTVNILEQLQSREDDACYVWMFGSQGSNQISLSNAITKTDQNRMFDVMTNVVESAIAAPHEAPDPQYAEQLFETLVSNMVSKHGDEFLTSLAMLEQPLSPGVDRKAVCYAVTELYREALLLPRGEREVLLRYLFSLGSS